VATRNPLRHRGSTLGASRLGRSKRAASVAQWFAGCYGMPAAWVRVPSLTILLLFPWNFFRQHTAVIHQKDVGLLD